MRVFIMKDSSWCSARATYVKTGIIIKKKSNLCKYLTEEQLGKEIDKMFKGTESARRNRLLYNNQGGEECSIEIYSFRSKKLANEFYNLVDDTIKELYRVYGTDFLCPDFRGQAENYGGKLTKFIRL